MPTNRNTDPGHKKRENLVLVLTAFACIYIIWGSTYLAIRYAVETIPPLFVASFRHLIAGALLFAWCWHRGLRPVKQQWFASVVLGVLFFLIGHGTLHWAEQTLPSGMAAILGATEPIFIALIVIFTGRTQITASLLLGVLLGLAGVALIFGGDVRAGRSEILTSVIVLLGTVSWSIGMVYSRSAKLHPDTHMAAGMSLLAGAVLLFLGGTVTGELGRLHFNAISMKSLAALIYLAVAGSLVSYSAYFWLLKRFPPTLVATHTYVNPLVALGLGWAIAGEVLAPRVLVGGLIIIAAIAWMSRVTSVDSEAAETGEQHDASAAKKKAA